MRRNIIYLVVGMMIGAMVSPVFAKRESSSEDATSIVGYGKYNGILVPIRVDADGVLQTN